MCSKILKPPDFPNAVVGAEVVLCFSVNKLGSFHMFVFKILLIFGVERRSEMKHRKEENNSRRYYEVLS